MYQLSPYGQTQAYNPYATAYPAMTYPTSYQTQMPASYTAQPAANDAFYNAAAWRAAMPTPNLTFNYNMGGGATSPYGQTQAYSPYGQSTSPYGMPQQQGYQGYQQYGQYPQASQYSPYAAQQQYSPYGQTPGAYPYGQAAGAYGQPGAYNPYAMQPGMNPMGGADMYNPAGMPGMDPLSNPATTGVDNLMSPPPAAPVEKKSGGFLKWTAITAVVAAAAYAVYHFFIKEDGTKTTQDTVNVKDTLAETKKANAALKEMAKEHLSETTKTSVNAALIAHDNLTTKVGNKVDTQSLQTDGQPVPELNKASEAFDAAHTQVEKQLEDVGKEPDTEARTKKTDHLTKVQEHIESIQKHIGDLTSVANNSATNASEPEAPQESK